MAYSRGIRQSVDKGTQKLGYDGAFLVVATSTNSRQFPVVTLHGGSLTIRAFAEHHPEGEVAAIGEFFQS